VNALQTVKPINAFIATSDEAETGSKFWGKFAYVNEKWTPQYLALDSIELAACDLIKIDLDGKELCRSSDIDRSYIWRTMSLGYPRNCLDI